MIIRFIKFIPALIICLMLGTTVFGRAKPAKAAQKSGEKLDAYLFAYFTGNSKTEEAIHFALSADGYHYRALNRDQPVISSSVISATGGIRDPHILRGVDGKTFYMVATDMVSAKGWNSNRGIVMLRSQDLINWTSAKVNIPEAFPEFATVNRVWAPQTIYDARLGKYVLYFSMRSGNEPDKIYYTYANKDFTALETVPKQMYFNPGGGACIDGDIIAKDGKFYLFFKTEGAGAGIKIAVSDSLTNGYVLRDRFVQQTKEPVEGAGTFKLNNGKGYILMYDLYTNGRYQFTQTNDLENFTVVDQDVSMNFHPRHGTVIAITGNEQKRLLSKWGTADDILGNITSPLVNKRNVLIDTTLKTVSLTVKPGTALNKLDPGFAGMANVSIKPQGPQNFNKGAVAYQIKIGDKPAETYRVAVKEVHNPVLDGYYADPDIIYSNQTNKFYMYPTTDGFNGWSGTYFKTFSSTDLVNWKDEGTILDLPKDVSWAKRNAWAPGIIEKMVNGKYKYYFYFCAAQKIGVAVADSPTGPFIDSGKPLLNQLPAGVKGGQQIDPCVLHEEQTGKYYLYWGNGYMAGAELNEDMISLKENSTKVLTPSRQYNEGTFVIVRNGIYYFMWSENDTRSPKYSVHYGTSNSPMGPITVPADNTVIEKDEAAGLYGTGHHSVIKVPGKDEWYIVYHRFTYPNGIKMGDAAGFNREVCIDKLTFKADGTIEKVTPTHTGILPVKIK